MDDIVVEPLAIRVLGCDLVFDLLVADNAPLFRVDQQHAPRFEASLVLDVLRRDAEHARFRSEYDDIVLCHVVARGAEAVAVEYATDECAVGKTNRRRSVPRLHKAGVILVEGALLVAHILVPFPRFGHHHHNGVWQRATA